MNNVSSVKIDSKWIRENTRWGPFRIVPVKIGQRTNWQVWRDEDTLISESRTRLLAWQSLVGYRIRTGE